MDRPGDTCPLCGEATLSGDDENVTCPKCSYSHSVTLGVNLTIVPAAEILVNPDHEIDGARDRGDYFAAFALSVAYFEYYGTAALRKSMNNPVSHKRLNRLTVSEVATFLYGFGTIDISTFQTMTEVNGVRNDLVHPEDLALKYKLDTNKTDALLERAKTVIKTLREKAGIDSLLTSN